MGIGVEEGYSEFVQYHEQQLRHIDLPEEAWRQVYEKLQPRTVHDVDNGLAVQDGEVIATKPHQPYSCVYIVPHLWSGDGGAQSFTALEDDIDQPNKILDLMESAVSNTSVNDEADIIQDISKMADCSLDAARSAYKESKCDTVNAVIMLLGNDKPEGDKIANALGINNKKSILTFEEFKSAVTDEKSDHELQLMYNDFVRKKQAEIGDDGFGTTSKYKWEDDAEEHVITVTIPVPSGTKRNQVISKITTKHWTFGIKGQPPIIYGNFFGIVQPDECTWYFEKGTDNIIASIQKGDNEEFMWKNLIIGEEKIDEGFLERSRKRSLLSAMDKIWYNGFTYQAVTSEGRKADNWYIPPRAVTKMSHSKSPNFKLAPFWSCYGGKVLTLLWPIKTIKPKEACTLEKNRVLYTGESSLQKEARLWTRNAKNLTKPLPKTFRRQYEDLIPPFVYKPTDWSSSLAETVSDNSVSESLTVVTTMNLTNAAKEQLKRLGITVTTDPSSDCCYWKEFREEREGLTNVNSFDAVLTNLIRLNSFVRNSFGNVPWWPGGYHLNTELAAVLAYPPSWELQWLLRCAEKTAANVITNSPARLGRMCENSLNYFAQPYIDSIYIDKCQCSLEFTVVIRDNRLYVSNIPAVHIARSPVNEKEENHYLTNHYIPKSDGSNFPSAPWAKFLVEFSLIGAWPATESKIHHNIHDLFVSFTGKTTDVHCYGVQIIVTPTLEVKLVGIRASPTYFPSIDHLADAWKLLFCRPPPSVEGFRTII